MTWPVDPYERELEPEEFDARLRRALADEEDRASIRELITWFRARYPTPEARLAYVRRKIRALKRSRTGESIGDV